MSSHRRCCCGGSTCCDLTPALICGHRTDGDGNRVIERLDWSFTLVASQTCSGGGCGALDNNGVYNINETKTGTSLGASVPSAGDCSWDVIVPNTELRFIDGDIEIIGELSVNWGILISGARWNNVFAQAFTSPHGTRVDHIRRQDTASEQWRGPLTTPNSNGVFGDWTISGLSRSLTWTGTCLNQFTLNYSHSADKAGPPNLSQSNSLTITGTLHEIVECPASGGGKGGKGGGGGGPLSHPMAGHAFRNATPEQAAATIASADLHRLAGTLHQDQRRLTNEHAWGGKGCCD